MAREVLQQVYSQGDCYGGSRLGEGKTVVIDFSAPNIAKPFGIGHLRSTVIGHALYLIFQALGYRCVGINHLGWAPSRALIVAFRRGEEQRSPIPSAIFTGSTLHRKRKPAPEEEAGMV